MIFEVLAILGWLGIVALLVAAVTLLIRVYLTSSYPQAFVLAVFGLLLAVGVSSEALHWLDAFTVGWIRLFWGGVLAVSTVWIWLIRKRIEAARLKISLSQKVIYGAVGLLFGLTLATGVLVAPNNWDSLTYHLTRAAHWLQNGNLEFFVTSNARQNVITPLPDLVIANLMAADELARLVTLGQWLSGVAIVTSMGLIAKLVWGEPSRVSKPEQISNYIAVTVALAATVPMLLSQMSTTQVDLIAGVPVAAVMVALWWFREGRFTQAAILLGLAVASSVAVKATSMALIAPVALFVTYLLFRRGGIKPVLIAGFTAVVGVALLSVRHLWMTLSSSESAAEISSSVFNEQFSAVTTLVNLTRNIASGVQTFATGANSAVQNVVNSFFELIGIDAATAAPIAYGSFNLGTAWSEDHVSAVFQVILLAVAIAAYLLSRAWRRYPHLAVLLAIIVTQLLLMSALFRWQPWINRFTFLIVVFATPFIAWLLMQLRPWLRGITLFCFISFGFAWVILQPLRGLAGTNWLPAALLERISIPTYSSPLTYSRFEQHFMHHPPTANTYQAAIDYSLSLKPDALELIMGGDQWEYPIWYQIKGKSNSVRISHYQPSTSSNIEPKPSLAKTQPERVAIICIGRCTELTDEVYSPVDTKTIRRFVTTGPATRSVEQGPNISVGLLRAN